MQTRNTVKVGDAFTKVRMLVAQGSDQRNRGLTGQNMHLSHHFGPQGRGKVVYLPHGARCCFHAYKSVAPLKRSGRLPVRRCLAGFHAYKSVAPLKHERRRAQGLCRKFPRLQKRGPIEARTSSASRARAARFHAYKSVAPLKQERDQLALLVHGGFHAYKSVAPLKHGAQGGAPPRRAGFPRLQKRGPIEAEAQQRC